MLDFLEVPAEAGTGEGIPRVNVSGRPRFAAAHAVLGWAVGNERVRTYVKEHTSYRFRERVRRTLLRQDTLPAAARARLEPLFVDDLLRLRDLLGASAADGPAWLTGVDAVRVLQLHNDHASLGGALEVHAARGPDPRGRRPRGRPVRPSGRRADGDLDRLGPGPRPCGTSRRRARSRGGSRSSGPTWCTCTRRSPCCPPPCSGPPTRAGVPAVTTLHSYRYSCVVGTCVRDDAICEDCVGSRLKLAGIRHACYHDSRAASDRPHPQPGAAPGDRHVPHVRVALPHPHRLRPPADDPRRLPGGPDLREAQLGPRPGAGDAP